MKFIKRTVLFILLLGGVFYCSSGSESNGSPKYQKCTTNSECSSGECINGICTKLNFGEEDASDIWKSSNFDAKSGGDKSDAKEFYAQDDIKKSETTDFTSDSGSVKNDTQGDSKNDNTTGEFIPDIEVDPFPSFTFSYITGSGQPVMKNVTVMNAGSGVLKINKISWVEGSSPEYQITNPPSLPQSLNPGKQLTFTVQYIEGTVHGDAFLSIVSNDPDEGEVLVKFMAQTKVTPPKPQACILIKPQALNFGTVERGKSKKLMFNIENCSDSVQLIISAIKRSSFLGIPLTDEMQITPFPQLPIVLNPGEITTQYVTYAPLLAGPDSGSFIFVNNDPDNKEAKLDVSGIGVPPPLEEIDLHIVLEWDMDCCDVDTHLLMPGGSFFDCYSDCHFGNMHPDWFVQGDINDDPFLDYDDIDGYGPENLNISKPAPGEYKLIIHYYKDYYEDCGGWGTNATVKIYFKGNLVKTFGPTYLDHTNINWDVCTIKMPQGEITPIDKVYEIDPSQVKACFNFP